MKTKLKHTVRKYTPEEERMIDDAELRSLEVVRDSKSFFGAFSRLCRLEIQAENALSGKEFLFEVAGIMAAMRSLLCFEIEPLCKKARRLS